MRSLIQFADIQKDDEVLDIAAGSGETSKILLDAVPKGQLTVLDASPQMLEAAKRILGEPGNVRYALSHAPAPHGEDIDIQGQTFTTVVIHLSLRTLASNTSDLKHLARWCMLFLRGGGSLVLCTHNTAVQVKPEARWDKWEDPFRTALEQVANQMGVPRREGPTSPFQMEEITHAFQDSGYSQKKMSTETFKRTMDDRLVMWSVPAVLDSVVDVHQVSSRQRDELLRIVRERVHGQETMPMTVAYWLFRKQ